ncbi:MAG: transposase [Ignavibacteriales bacterium]|nr:transposase [Ignavibacteriales bacterium]
MNTRKKYSAFTIHRRHLPHWEAPEATYFVTFRLKEKTICNLTRDDIAPIILNTFEFYNSKRYELFDITIMPDHVHVVFRPIVKEGTVEQIGDIIGDVKRYSSRKINEVLVRKGALWLDESYDRIIRNEKEYLNICRYIFENPIRAGFIEEGEVWKWWKHFEPK